MIQISKLLDLLLESRIKRSLCIEATHGDVFVSEIFLLSSDPTCKTLSGLNTQVLKVRICNCSSVEFWIGTTLKPLQRAQVPVYLSYPPFSNFFNTFEVKNLWKAPQKINCPGALGHH